MLLCLPWCSCAELGDCLKDFISNWICWCTFASTFQRHVLCVERPSADHVLDAQSDSTRLISIYSLTTTAHEVHTIRTSSVKRWVRAVCYTTQRTQKNTYFYMNWLHCTSHKRFWQWSWLVIKCLNNLLWQFITIVFVILVNFDNFNWNTL